MNTFFAKYPAIPYILKWTAIGLVVGAAIGSASAGFLISLDWATAYRENHLWIIAFLPVGGFMIGLLYHYYGNEAVAGSNLLIDTIHLPQKKIPFRMAPMIYLGTMVTHFLGGSAGREGTALQMAGAIADQLSHPLKLSNADRKTLIIAAIAGGFGSVFGTPIAGAIFGLEFFMLGNIRYHAIFPALITAIIADSATRFWQAEHTYYHIDFIPEISLLTLFYAIITGILCGLCAALFSKLMHKSSDFFKEKISFPPLQPLIGGIVVVVIIWALGTTKYIGLGIPTIIQSFETPLPTYDFAIKMLLTIITLGAGFKGGEVTPLFFIGATLGSALSYFIPLPTGLMAGMGFVAVFAGATNTPIACTIMAMELFGTECGVYVAMACIVSYLISGHNSVYKNQMIGEAKHINYSNLEGKKMHEL
jgi:H+/Cl- antiporter ClcA